MDNIDIAKIVREKCVVYLAAGRRLQKIKQHA
jgi:hypothetical protein